ncbi:N-alpha-acetyltransferase 38, NatC auxiliary subunit [Topomyia yanbarensis]|uniref:N-alpha-acetyltransferase 38, NatC auxiliary subunit n=1 Tax=Topomyia yanbarensis TaxID=2498891 RepID=UPI00273BB2D8|nr:N-alpha-acetyltransferase 38, NatC auxiliary subunit [Topomyia yanbarensis]
MSSDEKDSSDELWGKIQEKRDIHKAEVEQETNPSRKQLKSWLNKTFRVKMTDGRILIGMFVCTDADANVILGLTSEFTENEGEERVLGLVMIPGRYIVSIEIDEVDVD